MKYFCVDLEIAKELKQNGYPQDSEFYFMRQDSGTIDTKNGGLQNRKPWALSIIIPKKDKEDFLENFGHPDKWMGIQPEHFVSSPLAAELLKELPNVIIQDNEYYYLNIFRDVFNVVNPRCTSNYHEISYITHEQQISAQG